MKFRIFFYCTITLSGLVSKAQTKLPADEFERKLASTGNAQVLDVRTKGEFSQNHLADALNADYNNSTEFSERIKYLDKDKPVFVYCLAGGRSASAAEILKKNGFTQVFDLQGGMRAWQNANKPYLEGNGKTKKPGISEADFQKIVSKNNEKLVLVDFGAKWCPPCKKIAPILDEVSKENKSVEIIQMDVDENETLAKAKKIETLPLLLLYKNGKIVWKQEGFADKKTIENEIAKNSKK